MKKILSNEKCESILSSIINKEWERVDRYGKYNQVFVENYYLEKTIESLLNIFFESKPIIKVLKFDEGDYIPTFSANYSSMTDEYYKRYTNTNFIVYIHLNSDFKGGNITKVKDTYIPQVGFGIIQNKTEKCSISKIESGVSYLLAVFISNLKTTSLL